MTSTTHQRGGLFFGLVTYPFVISQFCSDANTSTGWFLTTFYCISCILGSLLADIDTPRSHISQLFPLLSKIVSHYFKHRTFTHSLLSFIFFIPLFSLATKINIGQEVYLLFISGLMMGHLSHLILDLFTQQGICLFYPSPKKIQLAHLKTGARGEQRFNTILSLCLVIYVLYQTYTIIAYAK